MQTLNDLFQAFRKENSFENQGRFYDALNGKALKLAHYDEDLAQEIIIAAIAGFNTINGDFDHWLSATARRIKADHIRELIDRRNDLPLDDDFTPDINVAEIDFESLTDAEYTIACHLLAGYTVKEIADIQSVSPSTIKTKLSRSRNKTNPM